MGLIPELQQKPDKATVLFRFEEILKNQYYFDFIEWPCWDPIVAEYPSKNCKNSMSPWKAELEEDGCYWIGNIFAIEFGEDRDGRDVIRSISPGDTMDFRNGQFWYSGKYLGNCRTRSRFMPLSTELSFKELFGFKGKRPLPKRP